MTRSTVARLGCLALAAAVTVSLAGQALAQAVTPAVPAGTPIQLMVIKEVSSRTARLGDRFRLRVNEPVVVGGAVAVPVGATAWGEIIAADNTGAAGGKGRLTAKLSHIELPSGPLKLTGTQAVEGKANTAGLAIAIVTFGLPGLLMKGGNALLKAGDVLTGYVEALSPTSP